MEFQKSKSEQENYWIPSKEEEITSTNKETIWPKIVWIYRLPPLYVNWEGPLEITKSVSDGAPVYAKHGPNWFKTGTRNGICLYRKSGKWVLATFPKNEIIGLKTHDKSIVDGIYSTMKNGNCFSVTSGYDFPINKI